MKYTYLKKNSRYLALNIRNTKKYAFQKFNMILNLHVLYKKKIPVTL